LEQNTTMKYTQLKISVGITLLVFAFSGFSQNQLETPFFNEAQWYFNPAASGVKGKLNANIIYSYEPSFYQGNDYSMSRAVVGVDGQLPFFKKMKQLNLSYGVTTNLLAPNGIDQSDFYKFQITGEKYKEFGMSLSNQFKLKNGHTLSIGVFYRWAKYSDVYRIGRYEQVNQVGEPPFYDVRYSPEERNLRINVVGLGAYYENKDGSVFGGISVDNSPRYMSNIILEGEGFTSPIYSGDIWNLRANYGMNIKLGSNFKLQPSIAYHINDLYNSVDVGLRLYLRDRYYIGFVQQDNGNSYGAVTGVNFKRFEIGASLGKSFIGSQNNQPIIANLFVTYKFLQKKK